MPQPTDSHVTLRPWQAAFADTLARRTSPNTLLVACPASGKTIAAAAAIAQVMRDRDCDQLVVVAPTIAVRDQWSEVLRSLGYRIASRMVNGAWPEHVHGMVMTYAQVASRRQAIADACAQRRTAVILDEIHHAGEQLAWGTGLAVAFEAAIVRLMLSGTPFRSDRSRIPFVRYDARGDAIADFTYGYPQAVRDGACRPVRFRGHDGTVTWKHEGVERTATFRAALTVPDQRRRLRASLDPSQEYLAEILAAAHDDLQVMRETIPDAAGLVVCDSQQHARQVDRLMAQITGSLPVVATSDTPRAHAAIRAFASSDDMWMCAVRMVSEGVDIRRLVVVVYISTSTTELVLRQVVGRAVRTRESDPPVAAVVHLPADPELLRHAFRVNVTNSRSVKQIPVKDASGRGGNNAPRSPSPIHVLAAEAHPSGSVTIAPRLAGAPGTPGGPRAVSVVVPELPPSPDDLLDEQIRAADRRSELFRLLGVYATLRKTVDPTYQPAKAHLELAAAVGTVTRDSDDETVAKALAWIQRVTADFAKDHPREVLDLARQHRRLQMAA